MNFITLYFPSYSSLAQPLKLFWTQSTVLPTHCTFRNRDITYKSPFTAKHYLRFIRAKSLPSAAMKVLLLFLKGFQLFAAGVAMPHKHAAKARIQRRYRFYLLAQKSSTNAILTLWRAAHTFGHGEDSVPAPSTLTSRLLSTPEQCEVPLISKLPCRGYSIRALCWTICQFICFPWDIPLTFTRHPCTEGEHLTGFSQTGRAQSCAAPLRWRTQGTLWGSLGVWGSREEAPTQVIQFGTRTNRSHHLLSPHQWSWGKAEGARRKKEGKPPLYVCLTICITTDIVSILFNGIKVQ